MVACAAVTVRTAAMGHCRAALQHYVRSDILGHNTFNQCCLSVILCWVLAVVEGRRRRVGYLNFVEIVIDLDSVKAVAHRKCSRGRSRSACAGSRRSAHASSHSRASAPPVPPPFSAPADTDSSRFNDRFLYTHNTIII